MIFHSRNYHLKSNYIVFHQCRNFCPWNPWIFRFLYLAGYLAQYLREIKDIYKDIQEDIQKDTYIKTTSKTCSDPGIQERQCTVTSPITVSVLFAREPRA